MDECLDSRVINSAGQLTGQVSVGAAPSVPNWASGVLYQKFDRVKFSNVTYAALVNHVSTASFANDLAAGFWAPSGE